MKENLISRKSKEFAIRIVKLYRHLIENKNERIMSKQLLRSGTSIGANIAEAECGVSKRDFLSKMYISFKECAETKYWLDLLHSTNYLSDIEYNSIIDDCNELLKIISSITKSTKNNESISNEGIFQ